MVVAQRRGGGLLGPSVPHRHRQREQLSRRQAVIADRCPDHQIRPGLDGQKPQREASWAAQSGGDEVFDAAAVEVGSLDLVRAQIRPVHLAAGHIQREAIWVAQSGGDEVFDAAAVEVGSLDLVRAPIRPVHLAAGHIQCEALWAAQSSGDEVFEDATAVEVGSLDLVRARIRPVHLAAGHIQREAS